MKYPDLIIIAQGHTTEAILGGKKIGRGVKDLEYSAKDSEGKLNPTLKLLEIDVSDFEYVDADNYLENLVEMKKILGEAKQVHNEVLEKKPSSNK